MFVLDFVVPELVSTSWSSLQDEALLFVEKFYEYWVPGEVGKAEAMRKAWKDVRQEYWPYSGGDFVLVPIKTATLRKRFERIKKKLAELAEREGIGS